MLTRSLLLVLAFFVQVQAQAQENEPTNTEPPAASAESKADGGRSLESSFDKAKKSAGEMETQAEGEIEKIAKTVDNDPRAKTVSAGILQPIYLVAESLAFPAFHWVAFALMASGVVSYVLQLVLGKLIVLSRLGFSLKEIISDAIGLAISVTGLVLTTQAAAENSTFTQHPAAVISASAVGAVLGIILYFWGQAQELQAAAGRTKAAASTK